MAIDRGAIVVGGGNFPGDYCHEWGGGSGGERLSGGDCLGGGGGYYHGGGLKSGGNCLGRLSGRFPGGNCLGGECPRTDSPCPSMSANLFVNYIQTDCLNLHQNKRRSQLIFNSDCFRRFVFSCHLLHIFGYVFTLHLFWLLQKAA